MHERVHVLHQEAERLQHEALHDGTIDALIAAADRIKKLEETAAVFYRRARVLTP